MSGNTVDVFMVYLSNVSTKIRYSFGIQTPVTMFFYEIEKVITNHLCVNIPGLACNAMFIKKIVLEMDDRIPIIEAGTRRFSPSIAW